MLLSCPALEQWPIWAVPCLHSLIQEQTSFCAFSFRCRRQAFLTRSSELNCLVPTSILHLEDPYYQIHHWKRSNDLAGLFLMLYRLVLDCFWLDHHCCWCSCCVACLAAPVHGQVPSCTLILLWLIHNESQLMTSSEIGPYVFGFSIFSCSVSCFIVFSHEKGGSGALRHHLFCKWANGYTRTQLYMFSVLLGHTSFLQIQLCFWKQLHFFWWFVLACTRGYWKPVKAC